MMEEKRGGGMSAEEREKFLRIAKAWHGGGVEKPEIYHQKLVDNFKRAAAYVGFNESTTSLPPSNYPQDAMLMLYGLYKQATEETEFDDIPLPKSSDELEQKLYWSRIGMLCMPPTLAMMNFVATVKIVDPAYRASASNFSRESLEQSALNGDVEQQQQ
ncbi:acyl-CoA-binding domain-containing protein 6-like [Coffea arabica]|uniref:Acyl-CoA-binding domain-containing protein 6-like n=1 Tax=Coffea arabica TaxID=13443 RepID=A0A6P6UZ48_COFAR|nr:acyl-CoA-binding domain-containing protein 6-like [Coffea arabica]